jgi:predicted ester cyclase
MCRTVFPHMRLTVEQQIAEGDLVVTRWAARSTHRGELFGGAPTKKQVTVQGITISRISSGKVVEDVASYDALGMLRQIGTVQLGRAA